MTSGRGRAWTHARARALAWQVVTVALVGTLLALVVAQTTTNLEQRGIASGFAYLRRAAGFEIAASPLAYSAQDSYARALAVGLVNTLRVALLGIVLATAGGLVLGVARLSRIWIVSALASGYVEVMRNTPLLLQLLFWYSLSQALPSPAEALHPLPGVFLCFRGLHVPGLLWMDSAVGLEFPALVGFGYQGGTAISPEFAALLIGLSTSTAAFIGEIVRGGILSVGRGQTEAAAALGLARSRILRLIVLPQAWPVIIPPMTSQYLNLTKNSSLAVAIGYPDLMSITSTTLNQTGQAIEAIALAMAFYLAISLITAAAVNRYGRALAQRGDGRCRS